MRIARFRYAPATNALAGAVLARYKSKRGHEFLCCAKSMSARAKMCIKPRMSRKAPPTSSSIKITRVM
jgi:hypothetical protein